MARISLNIILSKFLRFRGAAYFSHGKYSAVYNVKFMEMNSKCSIYELRSVKHTARFHNCLCEMRHSNVQSVDTKEVNNSQENNFTERQEQKNISNKRKSASKYKATVPRKTLISSLRTCSSVEEQIKEMYSTLRLSKEEVVARFRMAQYLENILNKYFPGCKVHLVGSSATGFGIKGSDVDLTLETNCDSSQWVCGYGISDIPSVEDIDNGNVPISKLSQFSGKHQLHFIREVLHQHCPECEESINLLAGRCPILNFKFGEHHWNCDLSFNNRSAIESSKLLLCCGKFDERVIPLVMIINYWTKYLKLIGGQIKFKSYAISLMIMYFLQTRSPPILPPLQLFQNLDLSGSDSLGNYDLKQNIENCDIFSNCQSLEDLLKEFFFFYLYFDFSNAICPLTGDAVHNSTFKTKDSAIPKLEVTTISIQDPTEVTWNVTCGVQYRYCMQLLKNLLSVCKLYHEKASWVSSTDDWGIALLIGQGLSPESPNEQSVSFEIPLKQTSQLDEFQLEDLVPKLKQDLLQKAAETVLHLMQYGLLFQCSVINGLVPKAQTEEQKEAEGKPLHSAEILTGDHKVYNSIDIDNGDRLKKNYPSQISANYKFSANSYDVSDLSNPCTASSNLHVENDGKTLFLRMHCIACNIWEGRSSWRTEHFPEHVAKNCLEFERAISLKVLRKCSDHIKLPLGFCCECYAFNHDRQVSLLVTLTPTRDTCFPPILYIFLKDYIPKFVKCLI